MNAIASVRADVAPLREGGLQPALSALRTCPIFIGLSPGALASLSSASSLRSFGSGQVVAAEGKVTGVAILVVKGRLRVVSRAEGGRELTLETYRPGDLVMDAALDPAGIMPHDVLAGETSLVLFIMKDELVTQLRTSPDASVALARELERRLTRARGLAAGIALEGVENRLYQTLGRLAREEGEHGADGTLIRRCPTQQELGNMIGACRETVSRLIAELARQEMVKLEGRKLTLKPRFLALAAVAGEA